MAPPVEFPGRPGENVFETIKFETISLGNRSRGTDCFSGSGLGKGAPLKSVLLYLSSKPRITAKPPSWIVTPVTRFTASATSLATNFEKSSDESTSSASLEDILISNFAIISFASSALTVKSCSS